MLINIIAIAIEKELFIPSRIKRNPVDMADIINRVAKMDNLLKYEFVSFIQYKIIIDETIKIKNPLAICIKTSYPPE